MRTTSRRRAGRYGSRGVWLGHLRPPRREVCRRRPRRSTRRDAKSENAVQKLKLKLKKSYLMFR